MTSQYVTSSDGGHLTAVGIAEEYQGHYKAVKISIDGNEALGGT